MSSINGNLPKSAIEPKEPPAWWRTATENIEYYVQQRVRRGETAQLAVSSGGSAIYRVSYGQSEPELRGRANFNSAIGSGSEDAYIRKRERRFPVLMILAGIHGHEVEGMIAALQLMEIIEHGRDLLGRDCRELQRRLEALRIVIFPLLNPDGRRRVPHAGWCGWPQAEMTKYGQGTRQDGTSYTWRPSKGVHPMKGDVGLLGAYFDDAGINLMHDEWPAPMSAVTQALLSAVAAEGPDLLLNLHSYQLASPAFMPLNYVPVFTQQAQQAFARDFAYPAMLRRGARPGSVPPVQAEGESPDSVAPFNLTSMCYHVGATLPCTFESPHGIAENPHTYEQLHDLHLGLLEGAVDYLLRNRREWE